MSDSMITKQAIAQGFKNLMKEKNFDKITISDITKTCGLNRQTFYYHFQDKYELLDWIYYNEAISVMMKDLNFDNWSDRIYEMLSVMKKEHYFYINAFKASGRQEFEMYLFSVAKKLFRSVILHLDSSDKMLEKDSEFIASFFSYGVVGTIVSWTENGMRETPEELKKHFEILVLDSKELAVKRFLE
ncbi:MAG: dihydroxyacetone kinase transcriptional activator DhaS [Eubacterium sp.]